METEKMDYRKQSQAEVYAVKKTIIKQWKNGTKTSDIVKNTGMCINSVRATIRNYKLDGSIGIKPKKKGRPCGTCTTLSSKQAKEIRNTIIDKTPDQIKMDFALWTRKAVQELILQDYGIEIPIRTVGEYLKRWGFTVQRPQKRSRHQSNVAVQRWLNEEYPAIKKDAKNNNAIIYWMDETAVQNCSNLVRGYSLKGQTPTLNLETKKMHINMVSAITNEGQVHFKIYKEAMNAELMKDFIGKMMEIERGRNIYVICDNLKVHHSQVIQKWVETQEKLKLFFLPSYSPEYNPDEYLNNDLKQNIAKKKQVKDIEEIKQNTTDFMESLKKNPEHVKSYFKNEKVAGYNF